MPGFSPSRVADLLAADPYAGSLGVELVEVTDDEIVVGLTVLPHHVNFLGVGHGGLVFSGPTVPSPWPRTMPEIEPLPSTPISC